MQSDSLLIVNHLDDLTHVRFGRENLSDSETAAAVSESLLSFGQIVRPEKTIVDFSDVQLIAPKVINALLELRKQMATFGGRIKIAGLNSAVREVFQILHLDGSVFEIHNSRVSAERSFRRNSSRIR